MENANEWRNGENQQEEYRFSDELGIECVDELMDELEAELRQKDAKRA